MKPLIQSSSDHFSHSKACRDCFPAFWLFASSVFSQAGKRRRPAGLRSVRVGLIQTTRTATLQFQHIPTSPAFTFHTVRSSGAVGSLMWVVGEFFSCEVIVWIVSGDDLCVGAQLGSFFFFSFSSCPLRGLLINSSRADV